MNRKLTIILALLVLAVISVSIVTAVNDTSDSTAASDDSDDALSEDANADKVSADDNDKKDDNDKVAVKDDDKVSDDTSGGGPVEVTIKKVWDDNNNAKGKRPNSITVNVSVGGEPRDPFELNEANGWTAIVTDVLPDADVQISEVQVDGYTTAVTGSKEEGYTITNTLKEEDNGGNGTDPTEKEDPASPQKKVEKEVVKKTTVTKTPAKNEPVKKEPVKKQAKKEPKKTDKHNTGNPVLLGVLAISVAGLAYALRRKE